MATSMNPRRGLRPTLAAVTVVIGLTAWVVTRPNGTTVTVPFVIDSPTPDASSPPVDTPPVDTPAGFLDPNVAWTRHTISQAYPGGDGNDAADVDGDGDLDIATSWEEGQAATISIRPSSSFGSTWSTFTVGSGIAGMEDAKFGDVDGDGRLDVISACEACMKVSIHFAPLSPTAYTTAASWTTIEIDTGNYRWNQIAIADMNGDGRKDIVAGGRRAVVNNFDLPAKISVFYQPATGQRTAGNWSRVDLSNAGWTMTTEVHDIDGDGLKDILVSDRLYLWAVPGTSTKDPSLTGIRWLRQSPAGTFTNYRIAAPQGDIRFVGYNPSTGLIFDATTNSPNAKWYVHTKATPATDQWSGTVIPTPTSFGTFQAASWGDLDGDGELDVVVSASGATGTLSGVLWLKGPSFTQRGEVSGPGGGEKWDNTILYDVDADGDLDIVSTEQNTGLGLVWFENGRL